MRKIIEAHTWEENRYFEVIPVNDIQDDINSKEVRRHVARKILLRMDKYLPSDEELDKVRLKYHGIFPYYPMSVEEIAENKQQQIIRIATEMKKLNIPCWNMCIYREKIMKILTAYILSICCVFALWALARTFGIETQSWMALVALILSGSLYLTFKAR